MEQLPLHAQGRELTIAPMHCKVTGISPAPMDLLDVHDSVASARPLLHNSAHHSPREHRQVSPLLLNCFAEDVELARVAEGEGSHAALLKVWESACCASNLAPCGGEGKAIQHGSSTNLVAQDGLTKMQAAASLVTAVLGCGVVALPSLMKLGGWIVVPVLACATCFAFMEVARVMDGALMLIENLGGGGIKSFEDFGKAAMGRSGVAMVRSITTLGFCGTLVVYTILIGQNVHAILGRACPMKWVMVLIMPVLVLLSMTKDMKALSRFMPIGITASVSSCALICIKAHLDAQIWQAWPQEARAEVHSTWPSEPESLGTIIAVLFSAFSVMGTVPCIRGNMQRPSEFLSAFRVAMTFICMAYLAVMLAGYWGYGNFVQDNVVQSMMFPPAGPRDAFEMPASHLASLEHRRPNPLGALMAVLVTIYLLLGFGLFFTCVMATVQQLGGAGSAWSEHGSRTNSMLRAGIVIVCICIGFAMPHFREIMSIMAAVCCSCNNVFFPLMFAYRVKRSGGAKPISFPCRSCHFCILILAVFCATVGVRDSSLKLIAKIGLHF